MIVANSCRCEKCKKLLSYEERIKITDYEFVPDPTGHGSRGRTLDSFNLCRNCYKKYNGYLLKFFN
jgi:hypothetical protein